MDFLSHLLESIDKGTVDEEQLKGAILGMLVPAAQQNRQRFDVRWYLNDAYYKGDQWVGFNSFTGAIEPVRLPPWKDKIIINYCQITVDAMLALLTNKRPAYYIAPEDDDSSPEIEKDLLGRDIIDPQTGAPKITLKDGPKVIQAKHATSALETITYNTNFRKKYAEVVQDGLKFGNGFLKVFYDTTIGDGLGEVNQARKSPFGMYIDPLCIDNVTMKDARYIIEVTQRDVTQVSIEYGVKVDPDNKYSQSEYEQMAKNVRYGSSNSPNADTVLVYECWLKIPYKGNNRVEYTVVCVTMTRDKILRVAVDPTGYNDHPYVSFVYRPIPGEFYGQGLVTGIRDMNDQINRRMSQMSENATLMSNPRIIGPRGAIKQGDLINQPGSYTAFDNVIDGMRPEVMQPANVGSDVKEIINYLSNWIQDVAQTHDVSLGRVPPNVTSGLQVELLQAADSNILSPHFEGFEEFLREVAKKMLATMKAKYPAGRTFTVKDEMGNLEKFDFDPREFNFSDIRVEIDSALAHTKAGRQNVLMELAGKQLISTPYFLKKFGGFNKDVDEIVKQLEEEWKLRGSAQPQAQQQMNPLAQTGVPLGQEPLAQ